MIKRLRIKFICITMALLTVMLTVLLGSQLDFTRVSLMQINARALERAAREYQQRPPFADMLPDARKPDKPDFLRPEGEHPCFILRLDSLGDLEAAGSSAYDLSDEAVLLDIYSRAAGKDRTSGVVWEYELQFLRSGSPEQPVYVFTDFSGELETMREMFRSSLIIWGLGIAGFLLLSVFLANWAIRPVARAWEQQRQFVADVSHELKTPLTVILTNAELLQEGAEDPRQRQFSDSIATMAHQMRGLVEGMLQLARADSGQTAGERERLDFSQLLEESLLPFEPLFFEAGLMLDSAIRPGVALSGNAVQLRRVVEILLDNALKYSAPGGTVTVTLECHGNQCTLSVASPGEPLTARQCRDIFKRFYRVDPARRRNGSYGLGLAIAERVVTDHRGRIRAEGRDGGNVFYVNLPIS